MSAASFVCLCSRQPICCRGDVLGVVACSAANSLHEQLSNQGLVTKEHVQRLACRSPVLLHIQWPGMPGRPLQPVRALVPQSPARGRESQPAFVARPPWRAHLAALWP